MILDYSDKCLISIVVPVYNVELYLEECANSILNQTYKNIEIIFVNDGSTDGSLDILEKLKETDSRIRIISKENTGYGDSVNKGIDLANGKYFCIVESDDYIESEMIENFYNYMEQYSLDVVKADHRFFVNNNGCNEFTYVKRLRNNTALYYKILNRDDYEAKFCAFAHTWAGMYKRDFVNEYHIRHNPSKGAAYQDNGFWFQTTMYANRYMFINKAYYNLRRDNPNSSCYNRKNVFAMCDEFDFIHDKIDELDASNKKTLFQISFKYRYGNYNGTMNRIDPKYLPEFYERMAQDFKKALDLGEIDPIRVGFDAWNYIYSVLNGEPPHKMISRELFLPKSVDCINRAQAIYIYGAGAYGAKLFNALKDAQLDGKVKGWIVSKLENDTTQYEDLPIIEADQFDWSSESVVILAMKKNIANKVKEESKEKGYNISLYFDGNILE